MLSLLLSVFHLTIFYIIIADCLLIYILFISSIFLFFLLDESKFFLNVYNLSFSYHFINIIISIIFKSLKTHSKLNSYLNNEILFNNEDILKYSLKIWKNIEYKYPTITLMAKNILLIPVFNIGVKRIFNTIHNVCHYY